MAEKIADQLKALVVPIDSLNLDDANARKHDQRNLDAIARSLHRFGQRSPIVVQKSGMIVRAGNGRLQAAKSLGWKHIAALVVDEESIDATAFAIADNRTAELAEWDDETLAALLNGLPDDLLADAGFSEDELQELIDGLTDPADIIEDEAPEPPVDPVTRKGDLWTLGRHRLLCGDSTSAEDVGRLFGGERADLCFTSPPYALGKSVALRGNTKMAAKGNAYDSHKDDSGSWRQLMDAWWESSQNAVSRGWVINVQPLAGNKRALIGWLSDNADRMADILTWDKGHAAPQMARGVAASRFEWLVIMGGDDASRAIPLASWQGTIQSVYEGPPQRSNEYSDIHAATMPVHLPSWVIGTLCDQCSSVYDPFLGSGTTMIAAEQLGRVCYGMEISPAYCDVVVRRWEKFTGQQATRVDASGAPREGIAEQAMEAAR